MVPGGALARLAVGRCAERPARGCAPGREAERPADGRPREWRARRARAGRAPATGCASRLALRGLGLGRLGLRRLRLRGGCRGRARRGRHRGRARASGHLRRVARSLAPSSAFSAPPCSACWHRPRAQPACRRPAGVRGAVASGFAAPPRRAWRPGRRRRRAAAARLRGLAGLRGAAGLAPAAAWPSRPRRLERAGPAGLRDGLAGLRRRLPGCRPPAAAGRLRLRAARDHLGAQLGRALGRPARPFAQALHVARLREIEH